MSTNTFAQQQLTLLIVSPNKEVLDLVKAILAVFNNRILTAENDVDGFALAKAEQPDVILATSSMHEIGQELCQRVRQMPLIATTPFLVLTTSSDHQVYSNYFDDGCDQILPIPFKCADIYAAIDNARKRNQASNLSKIQVLFKSGSADFIEPSALNRLLASNDILCFRRKSGVVTVGRDPIRYGKRADYSGPERRFATA